MKNIKHILNPSALFYWILIIGLGVKVVDIYLTAKNMFHLEYILQGFLLTVLTPTLLIAAIIGFASFIETKWLRYTVTLMISFLSSSLLFLSLLYYRVQNYFIFFPNQVSDLSSANSSQGNLFGKVQGGDIIFISDFIIILLVLLGMFIFSKRREVKLDIVEMMADYQNILSVVGPTLIQVTENVWVQNTIIRQLKERNKQLKDKNDELLRQKSELQEKCRNSQPGLQKEIVYCKMENANLLMSLKQLESVRSQLEAEQLQKKQALEAIKASQTNHVDKIAEGVEDAQESRESLGAEQEDKLQKAKKIAHQVYEEMQSHSQMPH